MPKPNPRPPAPITTSDITCLTACENANNMALSYHPDRAYTGRTTLLTRSGFMIRATGNLTGGFWITDKGCAFLARRRVSVLAIPRRTIAVSPRPKKRIVA